MATRNKERLSALTELDTEDEMRRAFGMGELMKLLPHKPEPGKSYHVITGGHIDLLSHVWWMLKLYGHVNHVFISCWAIGAADILLCERWIKEKKLGDIELILGEIFPSKFKKAWERVKQMQNNGYVKQVYTSKIHSKLLLCEMGDGTKIVVESSANCNMNPRVEQCCITRSDKLYEFYDAYLRGLLNDTAAAQTSNKTIRMRDETKRTDIDIDAWPSLFGKD